MAAQQPQIAATANRTQPGAAELYEVVVAAELLLLLLQGALAAEQLQV
jgi:hypothetical protein